MNKSAIYLRVSSGEQSVENQRPDLEAWVEAHPEMGPFEWFEDAGFRSSATSRPAWDRLMAGVRDGSIGRIVCWKMDRISRWDSDEYLSWRIEVRKRGCEIVSLTDQNTAFVTLADKIIEMVTAEARRQWLVDHGHRASAAARRVKASGRPWGGSIVDPTAKRGRRRLTDDQERALVEQVQMGASVKKVAELNGVPRSTACGILRRRLVDNPK